MGRMACTMSVQCPGMTAARLSTPNLAKGSSCGCTMETWSLRRGRPCHHMPDSKPKLTAPVGCAEEDVVRQAWQVVQVDCIPRIDAHGAPRHAQAEVHPLHGAGLDQLEAVHLASLQSKSSESASSSEAVAGQADKGGPVSLQPGRALHLLCFSSHCSLHVALCGVSDRHAGRGLCLRQAC